MSAPIIHREFNQLSPEWLAVHIGKPTASEFKQFMTTKYKAREGDMFTSFVAKKVAQAWLGRSLGSFSTFSTEQGQLREDEARPYAMLELNEEIDQVGFITGADGRCGCSPDGLIGEDSGVEIKCPEPQTHVRYLMEGVVPDDYLPQVNGSIYVSGRKRWVFMSYCVGFPALMLTVKRDEKIMAAIGEALTKFYSSFDAAFDVLNAASSTRKKNPFAK